MQNRDLVSSRRTFRSTVDYEHGKTKPAHSKAIFFLGADRVGGIDVANYLTEDLAQNLCAIKYQLELRELHGQNLLSSIADLQTAISKLRSVAQGMRSR
jgi:hypothetical protein